MVILRKKNHGNVCVKSLRLTIRKDQQNYFIKHKHFELHKKHRNASD